MQTSGGLQQHIIHQNKLKTKFGIKNDFFIHQ